MAKTNIKKEVSATESLPGAADPVTLPGAGCEDESTDTNTDELDKGFALVGEPETVALSWDQYLAPYLVAYPDEKTFFITTDGQVFLSYAENEARNHQRQQDHTRDVEVYFRGGE